MASATQPLFDALTESVSKALAIARAARRNAQALRAVAPSTNVLRAAAATEALAEAAETAAIVTAVLNRQERAVQAQLYPTTGRDVQAAPQRPPHSPHVVGRRG